jgi:hypothetical protein
MGLFGFPLLLIPFAIYNIVAFLMPGVSFAAPVFQVPLYSGATWPISAGDLLIAFTMLMLLFEVIKITRAWRRGIVEHGLAILVFAGFTAEFVLVRQAATPTFFLLVAASFVEAFAGFALGLMFRRMRRQLADDVRVPVHTLEPVRPAAPVRAPEAAPPPAPAAPSSPPTPAPPVAAAPVPHEPRPAASPAEPVAAAEEPPPHAPGEPSPRHSP